MARYTERKAANNKAYDEKTYKRITIAFRTEDDADVLAAMAEETKEGIPHRETIANWFRYGTSRHNADSMTDDILDALGEKVGYSGDMSDTVASVAKGIRSDGRYKELVDEYVEKQNHDEF